jgi:hypothetical protein
MFVVRLIGSDAAPQPVLTLLAARAVAYRALEAGDADRAEIYEIEGTGDKQIALSHFKAGQALLRQSLSRPLTAGEARAAAEAEEQRRILDSL